MLQSASSARSHHQVSQLSAAFGRLPDVMTLGPVSSIAAVAQASGRTRSPLGLRRIALALLRAKTRRVRSSPLVGLAQRCAAAVSDELPAPAGMTISLRHAPTCAQVQWARAHPLTSMPVTAALASPQPLSSLAALSGVSLGILSRPSTSPAETSAQATPALMFASAAPAGTKAGSPAAPRWRFSRALTARLSGPGGFYTAGNLLGLLMGIALQVTGAGNAAQAAADYLTGSPSALLMTAATLVFTVSSEAYHRAWRNGFPPAGNLNVWGDFISGIGALVLAAAFWTLGEPLLAATAGLMHAFGKFGSALYRPRAAPRLDWAHLFRVMVIASRIPAMMAALATLARVLPDGNAATIAAPVTLLVCTLLWALADAMLMKK
jgi:hypothetical protein